MKPQQPDIDWILKNRELVMRWHQKRGWWQDGDWYKDRHYDEPRVLVPGGDVPLGSVWLPTSDDVLEMLIAKAICPSLAARTDGKWNAWAFPPGHYWHSGWEATALIALMELLKAVGL